MLYKKMNFDFEALFIHSRYTILVFQICVLTFIFPKPQPFYLNNIVYCILEFKSRLYTPTEYHAN